MIIGSIHTFGFSTCYSYIVACARHNPWESKLTSCACADDCRSNSFLKMVAGCRSNSHFVKYILLIFRIKTFVLPPLSTQCENESLIIWPFTYSPLLSFNTENVACCITLPMTYLELINKLYCKLFLVVSFETVILSFHLLVEKFITIPKSTNGSITRKLPIFMILSPRRKYIRIKLRV